MNSKVEDYNERLNEFLHWLSTQPEVKKRRDTRNISSVVFQIKYDLLDLDGGERVLFPTGKAVVSDINSNLLFTTNPKRRKK